MKLQTSSDLARLIKNARVQRNLTQQDVADAVGITRQSLARLERGNGGISFDTVLLILDQLGIRLDTTAEHPSPASAPAPTSAARSAAAVLDSRRNGTRKPTERLAVPGSVLIDPPRTAEARPPATADTNADPHPDIEGGVE